MTEKQQRHIIQQQRLEVQLTSRKGAQEVQEQLSRTFRNALLPLYQQLFDAAVAPHEVLRLDKLELDLGHLRLKDLEEALSRLLRRHLEDALRKHTYQARQAGTLLPGSGANAAAPAPDREGQSGESPSDAEVLRHYLRTGRLPWHASRADYPSMPQLCVAVWHSRPEVIVQALQEAESPAPIATRLVVLAKEELLASLLQKLHPNAGKAMGTMAPLLVQRLATLLAPALSPRRIRRLVWEAALQHAATMPPPAGAENWLRKVLQQAMALAAATSHKLSVLPSVKEKETPALQLAAALLQAEALKQPAGQNTGYPPAAVAALCQALLSIHKKEKKKPLTGNYDPSRPETTAIAPEETANPSSVYKKTRKEDPGRAVPFPDTGETIYNAGLVILWPHLIHLFRGLGLVEGEAFTDEAATERAMLLLQYLATGSEACEEPDLLLNKLLCCWPYDAPVDTGLLLTETEKEEAEHLLEFTGSQWKALKGITAGGLRDSFIGREGIVGLAPKGWQVRIERTAYDLLIDKLPWSISMIKLPWNDYFVSVEW